jgi:FkbM family methyltransferase
VRKSLDNGVYILILALIRAIWHYSHAIETRFFQFYELYLLKASGLSFPKEIIKEIMLRPGQSEDWVQIARFLDPNDHVLLIDIGSNVGNFTEDFFRLYKNSRSICFEPVKKNYDSLCARFHGDDRVECRNYALSDFNGKSFIYTGRSESLCSMEKYSDEGNSAYKVSEASYEEIEEISCRRLDEIDISIPRDAKIFIKIDVQGHETQVVKGGILFCEKSDVILIECSFANEYSGIDPSFSAIAGMLQEKKIFPIVFQEYGRSASNYAFERDVIFVRESLLKRIWFDHYGLPLTVRKALR